MDLAGFDNLRQEAEQRLGLTLDPTQMELLAAYARILAEWNQHTNLTAIREPEEIRRKHFLDSLSCLKAMEGTPMERVVDVGSGGGFPGLVLRIAKPDIALTLVDAGAKKTAFLSHIVQELGLEDVTVVTARAEKLGQDPTHRERYDWAVARALAAMPTLLEYLLPLVKVGGYALAQKGAGAEEEIAEAENALKVLGGEVEKVIPVELQGVLEERFLVMVRKVRETPQKYPRREGMPGKRAL
jgi:16S rRNA (guanine527-N7)-methyltransferase